MAQIYQNQLGLGLLHPLLATYILDHYGQPCLASSWRDERKDNSYSGSKTLIK